MIYTIKKGKHRARPSVWCLWYNKKIVQYDVLFTESCMYHLEGPDMEDTNKLFGIGYLWSHHKDSARIGWRYNERSGNIVLSAYCYVSGERVITDLCEVPIGVRVRCSIKIEYGKYIFKAEGPNIRAIDYIEFRNDKKFSYPLGVYFGGNKTSPNTLKIQMKKV